MRVRADECLALVSTVGSLAAVQLYSDVLTPLIDSEGSVDETGPFELFCAWSIFLAIASEIGFLRMICARILHLVDERPGIRQM